VPPTYDINAEEHDVTEYRQLIRRVRTLPEDNKKGMNEMEIYFNEKGGQTTSLTAQTTT
jgi:DNA-binding ferritin-like protein (Dps family)